MSIDASPPSSTTIRLPSNTFIKLDQVIPNEIHEGNFFGAILINETNRSDTWNIPDPSNENTKLDILDIINANRMMIFIGGASLVGILLLLALYTKCRNRSNSMIDGISDTKTDNPMGKADDRQSKSRGNTPTGSYDTSGTERRPKPEEKNDTQDGRPLQSSIQPNAPEHALNTQINGPSTKTDSSNGNSFDGDTTSTISSSVTNFPHVFQNTLRDAQEFFNSAIDDPSKMSDITDEWNNGYEEAKENDPRESYTRSDESIDTDIRSLSDLSQYSAEIRDLVNKFNNLKTSKSNLSDIIKKIENNLESNVPNGNDPRDLKKTLREAQRFFDEAEEIYQSIQEDLRNHENQSQSDSNRPKENGPADEYASYFDQLTPEQINEFARSTKFVRTVEAFFKTVEAFIEKANNELSNDRVNKMIDSDNAKTT